MYDFVILNMQILSNIRHIFNQNQAPTVASSVGYIISCMPQPRGGGDSHMEQTGMLGDARRKF